MSYNLKITVYNNRDYEQSFILHDENGDPFDLTNCKLSFGIGTDIKTLSTHTTGSSANKCIFITGPADGEFTLKLPFTLLKPLEPTTYFHDLIVIDTANNREGIWQGQMIVKRGIA